MLRPRLRACVKYDRPRRVHHPVRFALSQWRLRVPQEWAGRLPRSNRPQAPLQVRSSWMPYIASVGHSSALALRYASFRHTAAMIVSATLPSREPQDPDENGGRAYEFLALDHISYSRSYYEVSESCRPLSPEEPRALGRALGVPVMEQLE